MAKKATLMVNAGTGAITAPVSASTFRSANTVQTQSAKLDAFVTYATWDGQDLELPGNFEVAGVLAAESLSLANGGNSAGFTVGVSGLQILTGAGTVDAPLGFSVSGSNVLITSAIGATVQAYSDKLDQYVSSSTFSGSNLTISKKLITSGLQSTVGGADTGVDVQVESGIGIQLAAPAGYAIEFASFTKDGDPMFTVNQNGSVTFAGTATGIGSGLTALNATNLSSGTVPDGRFPATLPAGSGVNLTALNATNLSSGTVPDGRFPATLPAASGVNLTALNASNLASGTVPSARLPSGLGVIVYINGTTKTDTFGPYTTGSGVWTDVTGMSLTRSPAANTNKFLVRAAVCIGFGGSNSVGVRLARDIGGSVTVLSVGDAAGNRTQVMGAAFKGVATSTETVTIEVHDLPATTSSTIYKVQICIPTTSGSAYVNRSVTDTDSVQFHRGSSTITIMEYVP